MMPKIRGVHHVKVPVTSLATSRTFYEQLFGLVVLREFADDDGVTRGVAYRPMGGVSLALRQDPARAAALAGYDLVAFSVDDVGAIDAWVAHLDALHIENSGPVPAAIGTVVGFDDPDGIKIVLYSNARRGDD
jgi:catechol 2,3-dioxygenase-like lactoylglutathione lyase family enzyme